ncbi:hypothetical protein V8D89_006662 [Ganoderma adspersum]
MESDYLLTTPQAVSGNIESIPVVDDDSYPGVGHAVQAILTSPSEQDTFENLHRRAHEHLKVFDDPRYTPLDTPLWVTRVWPENLKASVRMRQGTGFTVRNVVKAVYDTAEDLGLDRLGSGSGGRRYVAAAICACAAEADASAAVEAKAELEEKDFGEAVASGLQRLASTWAAFLLWPFYVHGWQMKRVKYPDGHPSSGLATPPWFSEATLLDELKLPKSSQNGNNPRLITFDTQVLSRDGYRCVLSGFVDHGHYERLRRAGCTDLPGGDQDDLKPAIFFKRSLTVYSSPSGSEHGRDEFDSMAVTLEILQHYCGLGREYVDDAALMEAPRNAIAVTVHFQTRFEYLTLCLKPTPTPHCYDVVDYVPRFNHLKRYGVPAQITFKTAASSASTSPLRPPSAQSPSEAARVPVTTSTDVDPDPDPDSDSELELELEPDPELIRIHAALAGVLHLSGAFKFETFGSLLQPLAVAHSGHSRLGCPSSPSGSAFWRSVVAYGGPESCVEVELREAVRAVVHMGSEDARARAAQSVE